MQRKFFALHFAYKKECLRKRGNGLAIFHKDTILSAEAAKKFSKGQHIAILCLLFAVFLVTLYGFRIYNEYVSYKDIVISIDATISKMDEIDDGDGGTDYKYWISYEYGGKHLNDREWKILGGKKYNVGDTVSVEIAPEDPGYIFSGDIGTGWFIAAMVLLAVAMVILTELIHIPQPCDGDEIMPITEEMVVDDLKPDFLTAATRFLLALGGGMVVGHFLISGLFSAGICVAGFICLVLGIVFLVISLAKISKISGEYYELVLDTCTRQWSEGSGDDTTYYTQFEHYGRITGRRALLGRTYYMLKNKKGKLRQLFDAGFWRPAIEDDTLKNGCEKVRKNLWIDVFLSLLIGSAFVIVLYVVGVIL